MTTLAASRSPGASSWPSLQRPPADEEPSIDTSDDHKTARNSVPAIMNYVSLETTEISTRRDSGGSDDALVGAIWNPTLVRVGNGRLLGENQMTLDANAFELWTNSKSEETTFGKMAFTDQEHVVEDYYPTCERLVSDAIMSQTSTKTSSPPIACVCAFDHNVRSSDRASVGEIKSKRAIKEEEEEESNKSAAPEVQNPAGLVHADYTKTSAPRRLHDLSNPPKLNDVLHAKLTAQNRKSLLDPAIVQEALEGKRRYAFINVWRSIDTENPVKNPPLACVDAATATVDDLRTFKIHYEDRVGENYLVCPPSSPPSSNREHSWYYYPEMSMQEALLLKQWDSMGGVACGAERDGGGAGGLSTFTIHSAFIDPSISPESPPRKSIEVRCVVIWEEES
eukprot:CAMPEP_0201875272 /NCGR_PEP_ID=MMETSP0902-20130614/7295_1 /ASSEMBLY_ACC=CAM_ASM_000551 /TAXON_ID=420261 /ORGANISM="Thalassiosira antarctica, Strain CCMP982" /LENGTH=394 /DNA_ID=CAMNT_0048402301 /DNA_START=165 /DNA_END=1349 /DNA_ORIENTATION=-